MVEKETILTNFINSALKKESNLLNKELFNDIDNKTYIEKLRMYQDYIELFRLVDNNLFNKHEVKEKFKFDANYEPSSLKNKYFNNNITLTISYDDELKCQFDCGPEHIKILNMKLSTDNKAQEFNEILEKDYDYDIIAVQDCEQFKLEYGNLTNLTDKCCAILFNDNKFGLHLNTYYENTYMKVQIVIFGEMICLINIYQIKQSDQIKNDVDNLILEINDSFKSNLSKLRIIISGYFINEVQFLNSKTLCGKLEVCVDNEINYSCKIFDEHSITHCYYLTKNNKIPPIVAFLKPRQIEFVHINKDTFANNDVDKKKYINGEINNISKECNWENYYSSTNYSSGSHFAHLIRFKDTKEFIGMIIYTGFRNIWLNNEINNIYHSDNLKDKLKNANETSFVCIINKYRGRGYFDMLYYDYMNKLIDLKVTTTWLWTDNENISKIFFKKGWEFLYENQHDVFKKNNRFYMVYRFPQFNDKFSIGNITKQNNNGDNNACGLYMLLYSLKFMTKTKTSNDVIFNNDGLNEIKEFLFYHIFDSGSYIDILNFALSTGDKKLINKITDIKSGQEDNVKTNLSINDIKDLNELNGASYVLEYLSGINSSKKYIFKNKNILYNTDLYQNYCIAVNVDTPEECNDKYFPIYKFTPIKNFIKLKKSTMSILCGNYIGKHWYTVGLLKDEGCIQKHVINSSGAEKKDNFEDIFSFNYDEFIVKLIKCPDNHILNDLKNFLGNKEIMNHPKINIFFNNLCKKINNDYDETIELIITFNKNNVNIIEYVENIIQSGDKIKIKEFKEKSGICQMENFVSMFNTFKNEKNKKWLNYLINNCSCIEKDCSRYNIIVEYLKKYLNSIVSCGHNGKNGKNGKLYEQLHSDVNRLNNDIVNLYNI